MGSSPLTRGKLGPGGTEPQRVRLIPAHAGKTLGVLRHRDRDGAHPRSRGENSTSWSTPSGDLGSSPLTRGKPACTIRRERCIGLIPAHAGKTTGRPACRSVRWAHPRSRGENEFLEGSDLVGGGSSPLTRGKPGRYRPRDRGTGLIPAHAGKTNRRDRHAPRHAAHPRSRGENTVAAAKDAATNGSSPLTRGKPATASSSQ